MTTFLSKRNLRFFLFDVFKAQNTLDFDHFKEYDLEAVNMLLDSTFDIGEKELYPIYREMDKNKAYFKDGKVEVHPKLKEAVRAIADIGLIGALDSFENGGSQLPYSITNAALSILYAANPNATPYATLTQGAANLIASFGSEELKQKYLQKMYSWDWQGTMALTEPEAGSALADLKSSASPLEDGSYSIKGQKIFISSGDHTAVDNVVHLLLARIDGAPSGTKGISLFVVPKHLEENGQLTFNDVTTSGIYGKMGQKGYVAAHLMFGEGNNCKGFLIGEPHKGLSYMFQMMNEARIGTGTLSMATASAAYHIAVQYAKDRTQGTHPDNKKVPVKIIEHADVRRMLLFQKSYIEGSMGLISYTSVLKDYSEFGPEEDRKKNHLLLELLTPVVKSYCAEQGFTSVNQAMQVLGGAGYTDDFPIEQYLRDTRVNSIYEGTTTIHGMDLLGRKLAMENGLALKYFAEELTTTIQEAMANESCRPFAEELASASQELQQCIQQQFKMAQEKGARAFLADASLFLEYFSLVTIAWVWLKSMLEIVNNTEKYEEFFLREKQATLQYFFDYELIKTKSLHLKLMKKEALTYQVSSDIF